MTPTPVRGSIGTRPRIDWYCTLIYCCCFLKRSSATSQRQKTHKLVRNRSATHLSTNQVNLARLCIKRLLLENANDGCLKTTFKTTTLLVIWIKVMAEYPKIATTALKNPLAISDILYV